MLVINRYLQRVARWIVAPVFLIVTLLPLTAFAGSTNVEPEAAKLLKASTSFLAKQKKFSVFTNSTLELVTLEGQKLQFVHQVQMVAQRPNKLRAARVGDLVDQIFFYDGKLLTLYNPEDKYYASVDAPDTLEGMLDFARKELDIVAPAGDLIYKNAYDILMKDVTSGFVVGKSAVAGVRCDHLAFRSKHVDFQIWIEEGTTPLPRKFVITSRNVVNAPQFDVIMTHWNLAPQTNDAMFTFTPTKDLKPILFVPVVEGESGAK